MTKNGVACHSCQSMFFNEWSWIFISAKPRVSFPSNGRLMAWNGLEWFGILPASRFHPCHLETKKVTCEPSVSGVLAGTNSLVADKTHSTCTMSTGRPGWLKSSIQISPKSEKAWRKAWTPDQALPAVNLTKGRTPHNWTDRKEIERIMLMNTSKYLQNDITKTLATLAARAFVSALRTVNGVNPP